MPGSAFSWETISRKTPQMRSLCATGATGLEPATSGVTGRRSNQLSYAPEGAPVWQLIRATRRAQLWPAAGV